METRRLIKGTEFFACVWVIMRLVQAQEYTFVTSLMDFQLALNQSAPHIVIGAHLDLRNAQALPGNMTLAAGIAANWWGTKSIRVRSSSSAHCRSSLDHSRLARYHLHEQEHVQFLYFWLYHIVAAPFVHPRAYRGTAVGLVCSANGHVSLQARHNRIV